MIDINKLNRVKGILSAKQGAEIPKHQTGAKFAKQKGSTIIYSSDYNTWFSDPNLTLQYLGDISKFQDVRQSVRTTNIPGGNPNEGKPYAALEKNAELLERADDVATQTQANALSKVEYMLPELNVVTSKNNPTEINLPKTIEITPEQQASLDAMAKTAGINLERQKLEKETYKNAKAGQIAQFATDAFTSIGDAFGAAQQATDSDLTKGITTGYKAIQSVASNFGPAGQAVSGIMGIASATGDILQALGGGTDQMSKTDKWMDSPLLSWNIGAINGFFGKRANSFGLDYDSVEEVGSSYGGTVADLEDAKNKSGKKYGLFSSSSRKKANAAIAEAKAKQNLLGEVADTAEDQRLAASSMGQQAGLAYSMMTSGGYDQKYTYAAKHGGLLEWNPVKTLVWEPKVELNWELPEFKDGGSIEFAKTLEWIPGFKYGGKTESEEIPEIEETTQKNVIPEGALHKNKHHMEHAEGLTKKGIPVIDEDGEQQAEIEHSEIIFTLEVTKKLEEYYEIFYSDESSNKEKEQAALEAGKLLVYQILENTEDRTGLIDSCKKGGSLTLKKSTDDLIKEVLDQAPTLMIVEQVIEKTQGKDKPKKEKPKEKLEKEHMKEAIKEVLMELLIK